MTTLQRVVMIGPFGLHPRMTMRVRALPLAKALVRRGHAVTMLLPPWQNPEDSGRRWVDEGVAVENVTLPRGVPGWFHWQLTRRLMQRVRALSPDVVHTFKPKAYAGLAHWALARRFPVVVDTDDWEGPGGWNTRGAYSEGLQRFFTWQERWGLSHGHAVTVASRALQTLVWATGRSPDSVFYVPNGARTPAAVPSARGAQRPTVLLYTRFFEYGLDRLWRVMRLVRAQHAETRFLVVGKGFAGEEKRLLQLARAEGWRVVESQTDPTGADLWYTGWGTETTLPAFLAAADIGIYPFDDTLLNRTKCPVKLMDLLAAGIPVVADAVGQIREVVVEGRTGYLVQPGDDVHFAAATVDLISDIPRCTRMGAAARADVGARYSWERLAGVVDEAYRYAITCAGSWRRRSVV